jgi:hypothetical protein
LGAAGATLALVSVAVGCGGDDGRGAVADYIEDANAVQKRFAPAFDAANEAYAAQAAGKLPQGAEVATLERAAASIASARRELAQLEPPADARRLHGDLLAVFDADLRLAAETTRLARYAEQAPAALEPLGRSGRTLRRELRASASPGQQSKALAAYSGALSKVLRLMGELPVPAVLRPTHGAQVERLEATRGVTRRLRAAVDRADAGGVARLLLRFRRLSDRPAPSRTALTDRGIRAHRVLLRRLDVAQNNLVREQQRLNQEVA